MGPFLAAGLMTTIAAYCAGRLAVSVLRQLPSHRLADVSHLLMASAMAGMLLPALRIPVPLSLWQLAFVSLTLAFFARLIRSRRQGDRAAESAHRSHGVACLAMTFMLIPRPPAGQGEAPAHHVHLHPMTTPVTPAEQLPAPPAWLAPVVAFVLGTYLLFWGGRCAVAGVASLRRLVADGAGGGRWDLFMAPAWLLCCETAMAVTMAIMTYTLVQGPAGLHH